MNIDWYEDFLALADTGKFTAAASMRGSSQSALSRRIQLLEAHLGATLIDRERNPVRLTAAGEALLPNAVDWCAWPATANRASRCSTGH